MNKFSMLLIAAAVLLAGTPETIGAQAATGTATSSDEKGWCDVLGARESAWETQLNRERSRLITLRQNEQASTTVKWQAIDVKEKAERVKADQARESYFKRLEASADSGDERRAVSAFRTEVNAAIEAKRRAVDTANESFRRGLDDLRQNRIAAIDSLLDKIYEDRAQAFENMREDCFGDSKEIKDIRKQFQDVMKSMRKGFTFERQRVTDVKEDHSELQAAHRAAIEKANETMRTSIAAAQSKLKAVMPEAE